MYGYIVFGFSCLCTCVHAEQCHPHVKAKRDTFYVPLGENHLLSCVVVHCGESNWTWSWRWSKSFSNESTIVSTKRHHLTNQTLSANETLLSLQINHFTKSDEGGYGCKVLWKSGFSSPGHQSQVLFTELRPRRMWHRIMVCMSAVVCVPTLLVLARCLSSAGPTLVQTPAHLNMIARYQRVPRVPRPPPRRPVPQPHKASSKPKGRHNPSEEVMYADVVHGASRGPHVVQEPSESTIYSSLRHDAM